MNEIVDLLAGYSIWAVLGAALLFGATPSLAMQLMILIYPRRHPRRIELVAEFNAVPYRERLVWTAGQAIAVAFEGAPIRFAEIGARRRKRKFASTANGEHPLRLEASTGRGKTLAFLTFQEHVNRLKREQYQRELSASARFDFVFFNEKHSPIIVEMKSFYGDNTSASEDQ